MLGVPVENLPCDVSSEIASEFLSTAPRTLAISRSTGRYNLPYYKAGRMVRYRPPDLIRFKLRRMRHFNGEIEGVV